MAVSGSNHRLARGSPSSLNYPSPPLLRHRTHLKWSARLASEADAAWWPALAAAALVAAPAMDAVTATGLVARDEAPASSVHVASTFSQRSSSLNRINMCATHAFLHQQAESPSHGRMDRRRGDQFLLLRATHRRTSALRKPSFVRLVFIPQDDPSRRAVATRYVRHRQRRAPQFVKIT